MMKDWMEAVDAETRMLPEPAAIRTKRGGSNRAECGPVVLDAINVMGRADYTRAVQYTWRMIATPDGSQAEMAYSTFVRARFTPDVAGQYLVQLEAATDRGLREYVTRVTVDDTGGFTVYAAYTVHSTRNQREKAAANQDPQEQEAMKAFALSADGARRTARTRRRRPLFRRIRQAVRADVGTGATYGEPISTF